LHNCNHSDSPVTDSKSLVRYGMYLIPFLFDGAKALAGM